MKIGIDLDGTIIKKRPIGFSMQPNCENTLQSLYCGGNEFFIITSRHKDDETEGIINEIELKLTINFSAIIFTNGQLKGKFCKEVGCVVMVDDYKESIRDCDSYGVQPILYQYETDKEFISFDNWEDIGSYLKALSHSLKQQEINTKMNRKESKDSK